MAKKPSSGVGLLRSPAEQRARIEKAVREGRFQSALEQAKELHRHEPTPKHQELLVRVYIGRSRQLRTQGQTKDARIVLDNVIRLVGESSPFLAELTQELAACGDVQQSLKIMEKLPEGTASRAQLLASAADSAVEAGPRGRDKLPEDLRPQHDLIIKALEKLEKGQDDAAKNLLQGISLQSPFLEWKVFIRGLQSYYTGDDARAVENWSRLAATRLPARLAAPLRARIDSAFAQSQPSATQHALRKQFDYLEDKSLLRPLQSIQAALSEDNLPTAFREAAAVIPMLRHHDPKQVSRLASCFYAEVVENGTPEDVHTYRRVFGGPPEDPRLLRLEALGLESHLIFGGACRVWQDYEKWVAENPSAWPGDQANQVRALIWCHIGSLSSKASRPEITEHMPPQLYTLFQETMKELPDPVHCLERSIELAPTFLEPYEALIEHHHDGNRPAQAAKAAQRLLEHFPDNLPALLWLGEHWLKKKKCAEAIEHFQKALQLNPLDRKLRNRVGAVFVEAGGLDTAAGRWEEARAHFQSALALGDPNVSFLPHARWAACEFKADQPQQAEEEYQRAIEAGGALPAAYQLLLECYRLELRPSLRKRFESEFKQALTLPPTPKMAVHCMASAAIYRQHGTAYRGQDGHEKKVLAYLRKAPQREFTEEQLESACRFLTVLKQMPALKKFAQEGWRRFPQNPWFPFSEGFALVEKKSGTPWRARSCLEHARKLVEALPKSDERRALLPAIADLLDEIDDSDPLSSMMKLFGGFIGGDFDDDI